MSDDRPSILITRPSDQAERFALTCRTRFGPDVDVAISPILRIETIPVTVDPARYRFLVLTSANAVAALAGGDVAGMHAYCVGERTAEAAFDAGLAAVSASGDASALVRLLAEASPEGQGLYVRGEHVSTEMTAQLLAAGIHVDEIVAYRQVAQPLGEEARLLLKGGRPVVLPLFSVRSAQLLAEAARSAVAPLRLVSISDAVDAAWRGGVSDRRVAAAPDAAAMLDEIARSLES